jgi:hypothetical protein
MGQLAYLSARGGAEALPLIGRSGRLTGSQRYGVNSSLPRASHRYYVTPKACALHFLFASPHRAGCVQSSLRSCPLVHSETSSPEPALIGAIYTRALIRKPEPASSRRRRGPTRRNAKVKRGQLSGPRMQCGWGYGSQLTGRQLRAHFTRRGQPPARRRRGNPMPSGDAGAGMLCGWRYGTVLTALQMLAHFTL